MVLVGAHLLVSFRIDDELIIFKSIQSFISISPDNTPHRIWCEVVQPIIRLNKRKNKRSKRERQRESESMRYESERERTS